MAVSGEDPVGSMGRDIPLAVLSEPAQAAVRLFQAVLRPGHQPADRSDPRGTGDVAGLVDRPAAQPAGSGAPRLTSGWKCGPDPRQRRFGAHSPDRNHVDNAFRTYTLDITYRRSDGAERHGRERWKTFAAKPTGCVHEATTSSSSPTAASDADRIAIPALLATAGVHHSPDPRRAAHRSRPGRRNRRGAAGPRLLPAGGLRRRGDQPLSRLRYPLQPAAPSCPQEAERSGSAQALHQGGLQGHPQGDVEDGDLHLPVLLWRPDLRCCRAGREAFVDHLLHRHADAGRGRRAAGDRRRDRAPPPAGLRRRAGADRNALDVGRRDPVSGCAARSTCLDAGNHFPAAARDRSGDYKKFKAYTARINDQDERS
jgi:hypothetical protein